MGSFALTGLTGSGHAVHGATGPVSDVAITVTSMIGKQRTIGTDTTEIQHVKFVGVYGFGCFADDPWGCVPPLAGTWETIQFVSQDFNVQARWGTTVFPSVWWGLKPGATIDLTVFW